jgi:3-oxoacyl-[acyl-carrier-protein] synthase-3
VLATDLHSDGSFKDLLYVDGGISTGAQGYLRMEGKEVFRHACRSSPRRPRRAGAGGLTRADVDWIVPHQANLRIIKATAQKMGVPMERVVVTVQDHGNTSAASIPLALSVGVERGRSSGATSSSWRRSAGAWPGGSVVLRW